VLADLVSWRVALAGLGALGVLAAIEFRRTLPDARRFHPRPFDAARTRAEFANVFRQPGLAPLFLLGLLLMGAFMSLYNYLGFRLVAAPFALSHAGVGAIFLLYIVGMVSSPWAGRQADRVRAGSADDRVADGLRPFGAARRRAGSARQRRKHGDREQQDECPAADTHTTPVPAPGLGLASPGSSPLPQPPFRKL